MRAAEKQLLDPAPTLSQIEDAPRRLSGTVLRTPLGQLSGHDLPADIYLKLENLQRIGCFKLRGAASAIAQAAPAQLAKGVWTASAGNMAQGVAWNARRLGVPCTVVVPDHAPRAKLEATLRLGGRIVPVPFDTWRRLLVEHGFPGMEGVFLPPVADPSVTAGTGTIALDAPAAL